MSTLLRRPATYLALPMLLSCALTLLTYALPGDYADGIALLAAANVDNGRQAAARLCSACHTFEEGQANKVGPNLYGVVGGRRCGHGRVL